MKICIISVFSAMMEKSTTQKISIWRF